MKQIKFLFILFFPIAAFCQDGTFKTITLSGTNNYTSSEVLTFPDAYSTKEKWIAVFTNGNTAAITLNRNTLGAKSIKKLDGSDFSSGDIPNGGRLLISYNGTYYQAIGSGAGSSSFQTLTDGPGSFSTHSLNFTRVNSGANALEYRSAPQVLSDIGGQARDANSNITVNNAIEGYSSTATAGGTTVLTVASSYYQYFTGSLAQTITLPVTSTLTIGHTFNIINTSSGTLTVNSSGGNAVVVMAPSSQAVIKCISTSGTSAASWDELYLPSNPLNTVGDLLVGGTVVNGVATPAKISAGALNTVLLGQGAGVAPIFSYPTSNMVLATATNDAATSGYIGEPADGIQSTYTNYTTTATYQNIASITLTPGDWDISAQGTFSVNSSTLTVTANAIFVISTTTASASGATDGRNKVFIAQSSLTGTASQQSVAIMPYRVSIISTTTYYLNTQATFTGGNPQFVGSIHAKRNR